MVNYQWRERIACGMGENLCQLYLTQGVHVKDT